MERVGGEEGTATKTKQDGGETLLGTTYLQTAVLGSYIAQPSVR